MSPIVGVSGCLPDRQADGIDRDHKSPLIEIECHLIQNRKLDEEVRR